MSDLVEALRRHRHHGPLFTQAADEIERLRTPDPLLQEARELIVRFHWLIGALRLEGDHLDWCDEIDAWLKKLGERDDRNI